MALLRKVYCLLAHLIFKTLKLSTIFGMHLFSLNMPNLKGKKKIIPRQSNFLDINE